MMHINALPKFDRWQCLARATVSTIMYALEVSFKKK